MNVRNIMIALWEDESGAITIDWVALTSGILMLGIAVVYSVFNNGVNPLVNTINSSLRTAGAGVDVGASPDLSRANGVYDNVTFNLQDGMLLNNVTDGSFAYVDENGQVHELTVQYEITAEDGSRWISEDGSNWQNFDTWAEYNTDDGSYGVYEAGIDAPLEGEGANVSDPTAA